MFLASALIQVRGLDEATAITDAFEVGGPRQEGITEVLRARIALAAGRLDDAVALAESASRRVEAGGRFAGDSLAVPVLAAVALRRAAAGRDREASRRASHGPARRTASDAAGYGHCAFTYADQTSQHGHAYRISDQISSCSRDRTRTYNLPVNRRLVMPGDRGCLRCCQPV